MEYPELAAKNELAAWKIINDTNIIGIWESIGATVNLVGSLKTGLLMKNRDIDFHIYTDSLTVSDSFKAIEKLAQNPAIKRIEFINLIHTVEECIEWHVWYEHSDKQLWKLDLIHIRKGSAYDGVIEKVTDGIIRLLSEETKQAIFQIKNHLPDEMKIPGIYVYYAVLCYGIRSYSDFMEWRKSHPVEEAYNWRP